MNKSKLDENLYGWTCIKLDESWSMQIGLSGWIFICGWEITLGWEIILDEFLFATQLNRNKNYIKIIKTYIKKINR